ncbi:hypothetical protein BDV32DRAFT_150351 [Aspergillus pseudonomiae]|uniref:Uncharacterized protein n=1 Tax=Aspergillus pseudonomiae TaxID=1506151 RepID=A0A5N7DFD4_9EURO|nr:uncharacterized protein BDV37DRAFT_282917 [Aspergillus pseudonomiae]KAB8259470.1 hypothetical protein BDV32DRAFT_150351 [Aspergillus pseudonomiae]KAE8404368.1 hypothetical protein BDV37DRAFT_282917 [Aspergillus pseudonomiae]
MADITPKASVTNLKVLMPDKAADLRRRRHRFIKYNPSPLSILLRYHHYGVANTVFSLWRPLTAPSQDYPLAVCDFRSISTTDLVATDVIFPHYCNEGFEVRHSPHHRWFYKPGMSVDDVILFTIFDNDSTKATSIRAALSSATRTARLENRLRRIIRGFRPIDSDALDSDHIRILQRFENSRKIEDSDYLATCDWGLEAVILRQRVDLNYPYFDPMATLVSITYISKTRWNVERPHDYPNPTGIIAACKY